MKVYVTKYALTSGVLFVEGDPWDQDPDVFVEKGNPNRIYAMYHGEGKEWFRTEEEAADRVLKMIDAKLLSLNNQRDKMVRMRNEVLQSGLSVCEEEG